MRISELSRETGVPVATIKFYLREGLLHRGSPTAATQADYGASHVRRLRLVRALLDVAGMSVATARDVVGVLDDPPENRHELLGAAHQALGDPVDGGSIERAGAFLAELGWNVDASAPASRQLERALEAAEAVGLAPSDERLRTYASAAAAIAAAEVAGVPEESAEAALEYVVVGTVLMEPVILALRRLAHEDLSARRFSGRAAARRSRRH